MEEIDQGYITPEEQIITKEKALKRGPPKIDRNRKKEKLEKIEELKKIEDNSKK